MRQFQQAVTHGSVRNWLVFATALAVVLGGVGAARAETGLDVQVVTIAGGPSSPTVRQDATFSFSTADALSTVQCALDDAPLVPCASPQTYPGPLGDGTHTFRVQATDSLGAVSAPTAYAWTIAPELTVVAKTLDGAAGVSVLARPSATFSRPIDPMTLTDASFKLTPGNGMPVAAAITYDPLTRTATLAPGTELAPSTTYTAELTTGVEAQGDLMPLRSDVTWAFTTKADPELETTSIAPGATGVSPFANVTFTFTRAMDPLSVTTANLSLWRPDNTQVSATPYYNSSTNTATLTPTLPLNYSTRYTIKLSSGLRAANGAAFSGLSWSFTTTGTMISKRINVGSATPYRAANGDVWEADQYFRLGTAESFADRSIAGTADPAVLRDDRLGTWVYNIPVPNGTYRVNLYFVELTKTAKNQRVFSLDLLDTPAYPDVLRLDIFREVGANAVDVKSFDVTIADSTLGLRSMAQIDQPELAALEILPKP
jgi:hypothetical protein